jgi:hypothetical protein
MPLSFLGTLFAVFRTEGFFCYGVAFIITCPLRGFRSSASSRTNSVLARRHCPPQLQNHPILAHIPAAAFYCPVAACKFSTEIPSTSPPALEGGSRAPSCFHCVYPDTPPIDSIMCCSHSAIRRKDGDEKVENLQTESLQIRQLSQCPQEPPCVEESGNSPAPDL